MGPKVDKIIKENETKVEEDLPLDRQMENMKKRNQELESMLKDLEKKNGMLLKHIVNLISTSRIEIRAKDSQILHLQRNLEDVMFRRAGKVMSQRELKQFFDRVRPPCN